VTVINIAKMIGAPGSLGFLAAACVAGGLFSWVWPERRWLAVAWLLAIGLVYLILASPLAAQSIAESLPRVPCCDVSSVRRVNQLFVLGGDNETGRVAETITVWRALKPRVVILLADEAFAQRVAEAGVPRSRIRHNNAPETTRAQIEWIAAEVRSHPADASALIASRVQMPRVVQLTRRYGFNVLFLSSPLDHEPSMTGIWSLIPTYAALEVSRDALYERAALTYYRSRGWIATQP
jgi:uncharacterized SAM-binding protein YcdF (DUF218 family)